nr:uncharacterized protein CI109_004232 [Kwoniella shandongensis]KAA5527416.1 hypothetical protein CI109_004232 [Kwoniella shandongensis]
MRLLAALEIPHSLHAVFPLITNTAGGSCQGCHHKRLDDESSSVQPADTQPGKIWKRFTRVTRASTETRRATKSAIALQRLILDPTPQSTGVPPKVQGYAARAGSSRHAHAAVPQLRGKDVDRLKKQLSNPKEANRVIQKIKQLPPSPNMFEPDNSAIALRVENDIGEGGGPIRAVCLDCIEEQASGMIYIAHGVEKGRCDLDKKKYEDERHRYDTIKKAPAKPARLPILLSLLASSSPTSPGKFTVEVEVSKSTSSDDEQVHDQPDLLPFGLLLPPSALSLHRPLAGALPSSDTLRMGFEALLNAERKIYKVGGPDHSGVQAPEDRLSVMTYWWGFELAMPPPTLDYLSKVKIISVTLLDLLSVIVYAVPGGARELAPFIKLISRYIETEFMPAAIVARSWDFDPPSPRRSYVVNRSKLVA